MFINKRKYDSNIPSFQNFSQVTYLIYIILYTPPSKFSSSSSSPKLEILLSVLLRSIRKVIEISLVHPQSVLLFWHLRQSLGGDNILRNVSKKRLVGNRYRMYSVDIFFIFSISSCVTSTYVHISVMRAYVHARHYKPGMGMSHAQGTLKFSPWYMSGPPWLESISAHDQPMPVQN